MYMPTMGINGNRSKGLKTIALKGEETTMKRRTIFRAALSLALALGVATADAADVYKIGFMHSFSGYLANLGVACRDGFTLAVDEINRKGGINGRKIEVVFENDESDTAKGVPAAIRLINNHKVMAFVGPGRSDVTEALGPIFEKSQIVSMTLSATLPTQNGYTFSGVTPVPEEARLMVDFMKRRNVKSIAVLNAIDVYDKTLGKAVADEAQRQGIKVVATESYNAVTERNFIPQLSKFKVANAEWMVLAGPLSGMIMKQKGEIGYAGNVLANILFPSQGMESLMQIAGPALEGVHFTAMQSSVWDTLPKNDPRFQTTVQFRDQFKTKYSRSPEAEKFSYAQAYDLGMLLAEAIKRAGPDASGPKIKAAMEAIKNFPGANGNYSYSATNHASNGGMIIARMTKGAVVLVSE
jgi:branched-chain amino acid transport system substrate-binding protein